MSPAILIPRVLALGPEQLRVLVLYMAVDETDALGRSLMACGMLPVPARGPETLTAVPAGHTGLPIERAAREGLDDGKQPPAPTSPDMFTPAAPAPAAKDAADFEGAR